MGHSSAHSKLHKLAEQKKHGGLSIPNQHAQRRVQKVPKATVETKRKGSKA